jgi:hypothetical protein
LLSPAFAATELARWAMKPIPAARYQPKSPRLICFFGRIEGWSPVSYQLAIQADGEKAHVDARDISADLDIDELGGLMTGVVAEWTGACGSSLSPGGLGRLPGDHEAGVALVEHVAGG